MQGILCVALCAYHNLFPFFFQSIIGQVTDTVKGVIAGGWLSNLVNSVRKTPPKEDEAQQAKTVSRK